MSYYTEKFDKKAELLRKKLFGNNGTEIFKDFASVCGRFAAFISISDIAEQAYVFRASADTVDDAWKKACSSAREFVADEELDPAWIKADITL